MLPQCRHTPVSCSPQRAVVIALLLALAPLLYGCPSVQINMGRGDTGEFGHPGLQECPGAEFQITVKQGGEAVPVTGTVAGGRAQFRSRELRDLDLTNIVEIELRVVNVPNNPGTQECPFRTGEVYTTPPIVLKKVAEDTYAVDADKFTRR